MSRLSSHLMVDTTMFSKLSPGHCKGEARQEGRNSRAHTVAVLLLL
jgi:hypothetical protein